jgi:hypothetical protein
MSRVQVPRLHARLVVDYFTYVVRLGASAPRAARRRLLRLYRASRTGSACRTARRRLLLLRRASRCLGSLHGSSSTTSPMMCDRVPRLLTWLVVNLAPSRRPTSRWSVALALAVCSVTPPRVSTTRRPTPDCTGSTAPTPCTRTRRLAARLLIGRLHWLPLCT